MNSAAFLLGVFLAKLLDVPAIVAFVIGVCRAGIGIAVMTSALLAIGSTIFLANLRHIPSPLSAHIFSFTASFVVALIAYWMGRGARCLFTRKQLG